MTNNDDYDVGHRWLANILLVSDRRQFTTGARPGENDPARAAARSRCH